MIYVVGIAEEYEGMEKAEKGFVYEYFQNKPSFQLDTETNGRDCHTHKIISLQLGDNDNQFFINCRNEDILEYKELIERKLCVVQNGKFDYKMLKKAGIMMENMWDTMLAECVLYCGYDKWGYGLDDICRRYLGIDLSKETRGEFLTIGEGAFKPEHIKYGCKDVAYLDSIREKQTEKLEKESLIATIELENRAIKALADIEYNGMGFNSEGWLKINKDTVLEAQALMDGLDRIVVEDETLSKAYKLEALQQDMFGGDVRPVAINYASPQQISKICTLLGHPTKSTDEQHLSKLKGKHPFFKELMALRKKNKIISTYGQSFLKYIHPVTGRIHTSFWPIKDTGRVSSGSKRDGTPNVQNIPAKNSFRNCFVARKDCSWVSSDYSGQEMRLMAEAANEAGLIDVLNRGEDIHCYAGSMMFRKPITMEDKELRYKAKTVNFMVPYGAGPDKLAFELDIPPTEGQQLLDLHEEAFPALHRWLEAKGREAKRNGYSITLGPIGRKRYYPDMAVAKELRQRARNGEQGLWKQIFTIEGQTERNGGNSVIQGAGADIMKEALIHVRELTNSYNKTHGEETALLVCSVHDAIDSDVSKDCDWQFAKEQEEIMVEIGNKYVSKVKMEIDTTITNFWNK